MNDEPAGWSVPWHELQRSLADSFGVQGGAPATTGWQSRRPADAGCAPASAGSWLVRARARVLSVPWQLPTTVQNNCLITVR